MPSAGCCEAPARSALCTLPLELLTGNTEPTTETVDKFVHGLRLARVVLDLVAGLPASYDGGRA